MLQKEWKDIKDFESFYEISNFGEVKRKEKIIIDLGGRRKRILKEMFMKNVLGNSGYYSVVLNGKTASSCTIHRLVAKTFIQNPDNKPCVNHIDGNRLNNKIDNLEWCTYLENNIHSITKLGKRPRRSANKNNKSSCRSIGVSLEKGRYRARIFFNGKHWSLGSYDTEEEASMAYSLMWIKF